MRLSDKDWFMTLLDFDSYKETERGGAESLRRPERVGEENPCQHCESRFLLL